jgi:hypothetical protein
VAAAPRSGGRATAGHWGGVSGGDPVASRRASGGDPDERAAAAPHEARRSPAAVATLGTGGSGGDGGRARRLLRGSAVCTAVRAFFVYHLLQSGGLGDDLLQSFVYACGCWLSPY